MKILLAACVTVHRFKCQTLQTVVLTTCLLILVCQCSMQGNYKLLKHAELLATGSLHKGLDVSSWQSLSL